MFNPTDFPKPTLISVNGVELEVFEAGQQNAGKPWIEFMEEFLGSDYYFVHFNRQPGVADAVLDKNSSQFLGNMYRKNVPPALPEPGMAMINL